MSARVLLLTLQLAVAAPSAVLAQWSDATDVRRTIEAWRGEWGVPGAAVAVVRGGEILLLDGFGVRKLGGPDPVDGRTAFELGSASKTFTATLAALAVEEGLIEWTTPLVDLLPELRLRDPWLERQITILDALSHRTGYARTDLLWLGGASPAEILHRARHLPPTGSFRDQFGYSNLMYILVGEALGRVFGRAWEQVVADRIASPLDMPATGLMGRAGRENAAAPHVRLGDSVIVTTGLHTHVGPAGGLVSSAEDLAAWMRFQLEATGALLDMREPATPLPLRAFGAQYARASRLSYGAGWFISDYAGRFMLDHIGGHGGMVANVTLLPEEKIGVAVLTNHGDNLLPVAVTYRILDLLLGLDPRPWNQTLSQFWEGVREMRAAAAESPGGERRAVAPAPLPILAYAGTYSSPTYGDVEVQWQEGRLSLRYGSTLRGHLSHWHHDTFRVTWSEPILRGILGRSFVSFHLGMDGRPSGLIMTGFQGERVEAARSAEDHRDEARR